MLQRRDGNQEVQGSPRFVQSPPHPAGLEEMATYLSRVVRAAASRKASRSPRHGREDASAMRALLAYHFASVSRRWGKQKKVGTSYLQRRIDGMVFGSRVCWELRPGVQDDGRDDCEAL